MNPKRRERRDSRKHQHRDAEQAEEEVIPDHRLGPDAGRAGNSSAMMEMSRGDVISPHERNHADHRQNKQSDKNQSRHDGSLGSENRDVKVGGPGARLGSRSSDSGNVPDAGHR